MLDSEKEELYLSFKKKVFSYIFSRIRDIQIAEDLTSEVFVKIFEKIDSFDSGKASLSTWVYQITKNKVIDYFRTKKQFTELPELKDEASSVEDRICKAETLELLAKALNELDKRERDIIILHFYSGKTLKEISENMAISYSYVKVLLNDAYGKLKNILS